MANLHPAFCVGATGFISPLDEAKTDCIGCLVLGGAAQLFVGVDVVVLLRSIAINAVIGGRSRLLYLPHFHYGFIGDTFATYAVNANLGRYFLGLYRRDADFAPRSLGVSTHDFAAGSGSLVVCHSDVAHIAEMPK